MAQKFSIPYVDPFFVQGAKYCISMNQITSEKLLPVFDEKSFQNLNAGKADLNQFFHKLHLKNRDI